MPLSVPSQRTWTVSDLESAALYNSNIRDAINFLLNPPLFVGHSAGAQSVGNNAWTALAIDTNDTDTYSGHSTVTNNSRYTGQVPGWYMCTARVGWGASATGRRGVGFALNGGTVIDLSQVFLPSMASEVLQTVYFIQLNGTGDYVEAVGFQDSGANLVTLVDDSQVQVLWIHA